MFGYAAALRADVSLRGGRVSRRAAGARGRLARGPAVARKHRATVMHGHWVIPGGSSRPPRRPALPLVVSLHGSDVYVAETLGPARRAARASSSSAPAR